MASFFTLKPSPFFALNSGLQPQRPLHTRIPCHVVTGASAAERNEKVKVGCVSNERTLEVLWDDGYGIDALNAKDYLERAREIIRNDDGGPPRWFCPIECGRPLNNSPVLLFLPGLDGTGFGMIMHHKSLGKVFEVRCLHIPVHDRTPFEGLVKFVEESVRHENVSCPKRPVYLVGESFGGCLALAVAARNPHIDLVLLLANPATSFSRTKFEALLPILEVLPNQHYPLFCYFGSFLVGNPIKMGMVNVERRLPTKQIFEKFVDNLTSLLPLLSDVADIMPKETLPWKLKLLQSAAAYSNSRLHAVTAQVLILASGLDNILPSRDEAQRLRNSLQNCKVQYLDFHGHTLLLEDGINLLTAIKGTCKYRRSKMHDFVSDFLPPSISEFKLFYDQFTGIARFGSSPVLLSTLDDGKIVKGLAGVPNEGPILLVGNHMLLGYELHALLEGFLKEKKVMIRGIAHPEFFHGRISELLFVDFMRIFGALPVTPRNLFKLFSAKSHVVLYPGGAREAFHHKGEEYTLFWPEQPEFVRMAAQFGATIIPFGAVGEDDIFNLNLDYNDLMKIPVINNILRERDREHIRLREGMGGEVAKQPLFIPVVSPKIPGRVYCLFGKPIHTKGRKEELRNRDTANDLYLRVKSDVQQNIAYLLEKRKKDPYRNIFDRTVYRAMYAPHNEIPTFEP